jgi:hypothetical protein
MSTLPADTMKVGNVWCEACQQSLAASRTQAHLASKKHADNAGGFAPEASPKKVARTQATPSREKAVPQTRARKVVESESDSDSYTESYSSEDEPRIAKKAVAQKAPVNSKTIATSPAKATTTRTTTSAPVKTTSTARTTTPAKTTAVKTTTAPTKGSLPRDPQKEGNFWCGICEVSLTPSKAAGHFETARHQSLEKQTLNTAMRNLRVGQ